MPTPALLAGLLLLLGCAHSQPPTSASPLDYLELDTPDGWQLRVHGDGSGTLTHRQHPLHHLDYPARTFPSGTPSGRGRRCRPDRGVAGYYQVHYYLARQDSAYSCATDSATVQQLMHTAIARMQLAVDDAGSERACRMLRRTWLAAN
ncbi:hypothetical protein [Neolewinella sp.]|uniref:hypothetical protein n=1 Tax=Neolewinella sp. TaxID=2993543 RepID=UPI003B5239DB